MTKPSNAENIISNEDIVKINGSTVSVTDKNKFDFKDIANKEKNGEKNTKSDIDMDEVTLQNKTVIKSSTENSETYGGRKGECDGGTVRMKEKLGDVQNPKSDLERPSALQCSSGVRRSLKINGQCIQENLLMAPQVGKIETPEKEMRHTDQGSSLFFAKTRNALISSVRAWDPSQQQCTGHGSPLASTERDEISLAPGAVQKELTDEKAGINNGRFTDQLLALKINRKPKESSGLPFVSDRPIMASNVVVAEQRKAVSTQNSPCSSITTQTPIYRSYDCRTMPRNSGTLQFYPGYRVATNTSSLIPDGVISTPTKYTTTRTRLGFSVTFTISASNSNAFITEISESVLSQTLPSSPVGSEAPPRAPIPGVTTVTKTSTTPTCPSPSFDSSVVVIVLHSRVTSPKGQFIIKTPLNFPKSTTLPVIASVGFVVTQVETDSTVAFPGHPISGIMPVTASAGNGTMPEISGTTENYPNSRITTATTVSTSLICAPGLKEMTTIQSCGFVTLGAKTSCTSFVTNITTTVDCTAIKRFPSLLFASTKPVTASVARFSSPVQLSTVQTQPRFRHNSRIPATAFANQMTKRRKSAAAPKSQRDTFEKILRSLSLDPPSPSFISSNQRKRQPCCSPIPRSPHFMAMSFTEDDLLN